MAGMFAFRASLIRGRRCVQAFGVAIRRVFPRTHLRPLITLFVGRSVLCRGGFAGCVRVCVCVDSCRDFARGRPPRDFWALLQENGPDFAMGSGLLRGFPRMLCESDSADLVKRCPYVAFLAKFACKTAQKLRAAFAGRKGAFVPDERISVSRSSGGGVNKGRRCVRTFGANSTTLSVTMSARKSSFASPTRSSEQGTEVRSRRLRASERS